MRLSQRAAPKKNEGDFLEKNRLVCYGCAHSAVDVPWPSAPSGERPCQFCVRNPFIELALENSPDILWYDGSEPVKRPMDAYQTMDMREQVRVWIREAKAVTPEEKQETLEALLAMREVVAS